jgi:glycine betaine/choline ABC-type transport system substrate-binding protein
MDSLDEFQKAIAEETLTDRYVNVQDGYSTTAKVEGAELRISLKKA